MLYANQSQTYIGDWFVLKDLYRYKEPQHS
jgi:hypothetical protein